MRTHPVFYVGLLKPYRDPARVSPETLAPGRMRAAKQREVAKQQEAARQQDADAQHQRSGTQDTAGRQEAAEPLGLSNLTLEVRDPMLHRLGRLEPTNAALNILKIIR
ncbi:hypothetical protein H257_19341 [Aphanomyces astaci]|uniref:Uncharacterized protein n=1 Tax=Aphanomyces astaci TaxID=112090 RepID=W4F8C3_APHAT|nr:hypothetical protein H257_19341 [Aphanomyces astaci]ETV63725.1 hypothetical protein H257_19341 [Aphanomyces astaci]|eukprot:XP_009846790.1 hypothetical protein H257_19341 [Aphanomyces astaci]